MIGNIGICGKKKADSLFKGYLILTRSHGPTVYYT